MYAETKNDSKLIFDYLKGIIVAMLISLGLVVLFAFCIKWFTLLDVLIMPITLVIKCLSVLVGALLAVKGESKGLVKGAGFGAIYIVVAFVIFSILAGTFDIGLSLLLDMVCSSIVGGIVGVVKVNKK